LRKYDYVSAHSEDLAIGWHTMEGSVQCRSLIAMKKVYLAWKQFTRPSMLIPLGALLHMPASIDIINSN